MKSGAREIGHLTVGVLADIAVMRLVRSDFGFIDADRLRMRGTQQLVAELTLHDGRVVWDLNGMSSQGWENAGK